jgi:hypothetical protein
LEGVAVDTTLNLRQNTGLLGWVRRHPLTAFLIMGVGLALLVMTVAILAQYGVVPGRSIPGRVGLEMERGAAGLSILVLFPAALLITALEGGRPAVRELFARMLRWHVGIVWWVIALLALPTTTVLLAVLLGDSPHVPGPRILAGELLGLAARFFLINIWEEATWARVLSDPPRAPAQLLRRGRPHRPAFHRRAHAAPDHQWRGCLGPRPRRGVRLVISS